VNLAATNKCLSYFDESSMAAINTRADRNNDYY